LDGIWPKEKAPAWRSALHTLRSATRRRAASIVACSAGIAACGKGQRWPEAVGILKDLKAPERATDVVIAPCFMGPVNTCFRR